MQKIIFLLIFTIPFFINTPGYAVESLEEEYDPVSIIQQNWIYYAQEPLIDLQFARKAFENNDFETAAYTLRQVNAYLVLETFRLDDGEGGLNQAIKEIDQLAAQLVKGDTVSIEAYNKVLTEVNYALASHYHAQAKRSWENDKPKRTGHALQASANYLERAEKISSNNFTEDDKLIIKESKELSKKLINGNIKPQKEEVKPKIKALGGLLRNFKVKNDEELRIERSF